MKIETQVFLIVQKLTQKKETVSFAESCTGGLISKTITDTPGTSKIFNGAAITYSNESKSKLLDIKPSLLKKNGAVSQEIAGKMAAGARKLFKTTYAVSVTGIAGPSGGTTKKPVGLVYIGFASARRTVVTKHLLKGTRTNIRSKTLKAALTALYEQII